jgi:DNA modification methylase
VIEKQTIGDATLYLGDCRDVFISPDLEGIEADLLVSDPPYRLTSGGKSKHKTSMRGGSFDPENYNNDGEIVTCNISWDDVMIACALCLKADADAYVFANDKNLSKAFNASAEAGFSTHNVLIWDKVTPVPNRWYMKNVEFILYLWKGKAKTINDPSAKQLIRVPHKDETSHPTEKPVSLLEHYIRNSSQPGETVIDPFAGTGSTGVAALRAGRKFIGVEIEPEWFDVSCKRLERATEQQGLFEGAA